MSSNKGPPAPVPAPVPVPVTPPKPTNSSPATETIIPIQPSPTPPAPSTEAPTLPTSAVISPVSSPSVPARSTVVATIAPSSGITVLTSTTPTANQQLPTTSFNPAVGPSVITETSITFQTPFGSATPTVNNDATSTPFFQNKGAVAGVFTVVGLIGIAILVALITNAVRRNRAKKFDRDVAEAAAEAARAPVFLDDDPFNDQAGYGPRYGGSYDDAYSGGSHGAYNQPPLTHSNIAPGETYPMAEIHEGYGAAGVGALGRNKSLARSQSQHNQASMSYSYMLKRGIPYPSCECHFRVAPSKLKRVLEY
jgi:hypothetical protein